MKRPLRLLGGPVQSPPIVPMTVYRWPSGVFALPGAALSVRGIAWVMGI